MMPIKRMLLRFFLVFEVFLFGYMYFFGKNGLQELHVLKSETMQFDQEVQQLAQDIEGLEAEIVAWEENDFCKEKIAREQLQMACKNDEIYYIS